MFKFMYRVYLEDKLTQEEMKNGAIVTGWDSD
jgi:hypothetical protein